MALLSVNTIPEDDVYNQNNNTVAADADSEDEDWFPNDGKEIFVVDNQSGGSIDITIKAQRQCERGTLHDVVITCPDAQVSEIGGIDPEWFNDNDGMCHIGYASTNPTGVNVEVKSV